MADINKKVTEIKNRSTLKPPYLLLNISVGKRFLAEALQDRSSLPKDPDNLFGTKESSLGLGLAEHLLRVSQNSSIYMGNICLYMPPDSELVPSVSFAAASSAEFLTSLYGRSSLAVEAFPCHTTSEVVLMKRYWQMAWFSRVRRVLANLYGQPPIPLNTKYYTTEELQSSFESNPAFSWNSIPQEYRYGYHYFRGKLKVLNFNENTKGDLC